MKSSFWFRKWKGRIMRKIIKEGLDMHFILEHLPSYCKALDSVPSNKGAKAVLEEGITISSVGNPWSSNTDG